VDLLEERAIDCPWCGEIITVLLDLSLDEQRYVEDCFVCCRPIELTVRVGGAGEASVDVAAESR